MSHYFPDQMIHGVPGNLRPWDIRFDPTLPAHLSRMGGDLRIRLITEAGFARADLVVDDGTTHSMDEVGTSGRVQVWETVMQPVGPLLRFSFALLTTEGVPVYRVPAGISNAVERLDRWEIDTASVVEIEVPEWVRGAVIYQIFPERFRNAHRWNDPPQTAAWGSEPGWLDFQGGDLAGIAEKAPYLAGLGVDAVYVNPIFRSPSTHRYDTIDYYEVDPMLGGNEALRALITALHDVGIRLIVDASFNHCHPRFFAFADLLANGPESQYASWFVVEDWPARVIVRPHAMEQASFRDPATYLEYLRRFSTESGVPIVEADDDGRPVSPTYEAWYGVPSLPRVNLAEPGARAYFLDVARHWVREFGIDGWRMDVARYIDFDFWPEFRAAVKETHPNVYLLAEIMGDATRWLDGTTFDATMNYTFRQICVDFLATDLIDGSAAVDGLVRMYAGYSPETSAVCQNLIGSHDTARFLHETGERAERLLMATVMQMTLPGAPGLYYGDEVGMTGGEEPASRGAFPWHDEESRDGRQLEAVHRLGALRKAHPALRHGSLRMVWHDADALAFTREHGGERLLVVVDRSIAPRRLRLPVAAGDPTTLFGHAEVDGGSDTTVAMPGASAVVILL